MLTKDDFIRHILGEAPRTKARATKKDTGHIEGFDFADDAPDSEATEDTRFVTPLLQAGFGDGQGIPRATVIRSADAVAKYIPDEVRYWPKTPTRPHHTLLIEANLTHRELLAIPAFKSRQLAHLDIAEDAVARLVAEALEGFQRGAEGLDASALKGQKHETLCVVSIIDEREGHAGRLACFGTFNAKTEGLETFFLTEHARTWDRADARERLGLIYERQFKKLGEAAWQEAFTTTDERKQAEKLLEVCTKKNVVEKDVQESILDLLDTIARGFGLRKKADAERRLRAFPLPAEHDIGIDSEERETKYGGTNPFSGVTLRDDHSRLLGYIVYPLKTKSDAEKLRQHLERNNRFHNVLVVYPDANQASIELWQGREQLTGKLRKGQGHKDAADVVNLLSRFFIVSKAKVRNPSELAQELAYRARYLRRLALKQLEEEPERGPLRNLYNAFKVALVHDQKEDEFADAFAQTITYGLLTARWLGNEQIVTTGERFTRQSALKHLPAASPFLNDLFKSALSVKMDEQRGRLLWLVDDVADLLDRIDVTYVFGAGDKGSDTATDPVIHFYEPFLAAYDSKQKLQRGVFFTPRPVVSYIVRSAHELLQKQFGLEDGLGSTDTWGDVAKRIKGLEIPEGTKSSDPFVCILDPATGTGTFLYECIELIERTMKDRWCRELGAKSWSDERILSHWKAYVAAALLPRIHGYELMMASYAVAHLKISFKLAETGCELSGGAASRLHVYLTNSLDAPSKAQSELEGISPALAAEARAVARIKNERRFTVVMGNPPYSESSSNSGEWIDALMERYKTTIRTEEAQIKAVSNDYVKFLCLADHTVRRAGAGVFGMITGNGYVDGRLFRDLRGEWTRHHATIDVVNLHGSLRRGDGAEDDENVFDIMQGVAIVVAAASPTAHGKCRVTYRELRGSRAAKSEALLAVSATSPTEVHPAAPLFLFCPTTEKEAALDAWSLGAIFGTGDPRKDRNVTYAGGFKTRQDSFTVGFEEAELVARIDELADPALSEATLRERYGLCSTAHFEFPRARKAARSGELRSAIRWLRYRPFDDRPMIWAREVLCEPQIEVTRHLLKPNLCLVASRVVKDDKFAHVSIARGPVEVISLSSSTSTNAYMFPLYRYLSEALLGPKERRIVNLSTKFLSRLAETTGFTWRESARSERDPSFFGPEDVVAYAYALLHANSYRQWFGDELKRDFPVIPLPRTGALFTSLVGLGRTLMSLHLLEDATAGSPAAFVGSGARVVERVSYEAQSAWIDKGKSVGFQGVTEAVWGYQVGGYQVLEKWLKSRKGRTLSKADVKHFVRVVGVLEATLSIVEKIEAALQSHGGWPGAFVTKASAS